MNKFLAINDFPTSALLIHKKMCIQCQEMMQKERRINLIKEDRSLFEVRYMIINKMFSFFLLIFTKERKNARHENTRTRDNDGRRKKFKK